MAHSGSKLMGKGFYLLADNSVESCYFVSRFIEAFGQSDRFLGVVAGESRPGEDILRERESLHERFGGVTDRSDEIEQICSRLYQPLNPTSRRMIQAYGLPRFPMSHHERTIFLGSDINAPGARHRMNQLLENGSSCWLVNYLPKLLEPWWIELAQSRILNCHSAVLPHARGMYAIEHIAASRDISAFRKAAGVTIHYVDAGIDTGPIIRAERLTDPFRFSSLPELKGELYRSGIEWYVLTVREITESIDTEPAGVVPNPAQKGPLHLKERFTDDRRRQADAGYLWMKSQCVGDTG